MSSQASKLVASQLILKPDSVLGLATGSTPIGLYDKLIEMNKRNEIDFSTVTTFNLDEYYPIKKSNNQSYDYFMNEHLFSKINIDKNNTHIPNGETDNPEEECKNYERLIKQHGGIDLQILGIGKNGHIGFNEPDNNLNSVTHLTDLTESTIDANSRFFESADDVPKKALTMGISTILKSKKIILLASGANKSRVVGELLTPEINTSIPATMLKVHPDVVLICDRDAYSGVRLGVDIGGTSVKFAVVEGGTVKYKSSIPTEKASADKFIKNIADECKRINKNYPFKTVGIGTPGFIKNGLVTAVNLPFRDTPLAKKLSEYIDIPITVDNDANCAALGESELGVGKKYDNIIMVTLGTGVGGGIIIDGEICHGKNSMGEIGHIIVEAKGGLPCPCGQNGCWEQYASVTALIRQAEEAALNNKDSKLYEKYAQNGNRLDGELIFKALDEGCETANKVFDEYIDWVAVGIKSLINIFGPDAIILAGGITQQGDRLIKPLRERVNTDVVLEISQLQNDAGALGAAML
jgi:glucosamine-6-phosphate deaminase